MKCAQCSWDLDRVPRHTWTIEIEASYPSQNQLGGNHRSGFKYRNIRNRFARLLKDQLNAIPAARKFRAAVVTRLVGKGKRFYDEENLVGGGKPLIDTLRDYAVIVDDTPGAWKGWYQQAKSPDGVDRIRIQLMEYSD